MKNIEINVAIICIVTFAEKRAFACVSETFLLSILTFTMGGKIENSIGGAPGPQRTASASVRRFPVLSGLRSTYPSGSTVHH